MLASAERRAYFPGETLGVRSAISRIEGTAVCAILTSQFSSAFCLAQSPLTGPLFFSSYGRLILKVP